MKRLTRLLRLPASFTVFLLFFGISLLEAFRTQHWISVLFWIAIAVMFLVADGFKFRKLYHKGGESLKSDDNED